MTGALMEARGLTRRFGSVTALDGVDFDLKPGEIHCPVRGKRSRQVDAGLDPRGRDRAG